MKRALVRQPYAWPFLISCLVLGCCSLPAQQTSGSKPGFARKLRTSDAATARALEQQGAARIADYGSFQVFQAGQGVALNSVGKEVEDISEQNFIELNGGRL